MIHDNIQLSRIDLETGKMAFLAIYTIRIFKIKNQKSKQRDFTPITRSVTHTRVSFCSFAGNVDLSLSMGEKQIPPLTLDAIRIQFDKLLTNTPVLLTTYRLLQILLRISILKKE